MRCMSNITLSLPFMQSSLKSGKEYAIYKYENEGGGCSNG